MTNRTVSRHVTRILTAVLSLAIVLAACTPRRKPLPTRHSVAARNDTATYDGIDISSHQGAINWEKVSSDKDIRFVYIKASEGSTYRSKEYGYNVTMARRNGLLVGSYHYLTTTSPITEQFRNFTHMVNKTSQDLIPMVDVEEREKWTRSQLIDSLTLLVNMLEEHYGKKPMIYSTMGFYNKNLAPKFNKYPLYIGRYSNKAPRINWKGRYTIWQYSENGIVPGIDTYVDMCRYRRDGWLDELLLNN